MHTATEARPVNWLCCGCDCSTSSPVCAAACQCRPQMECRCECPCPDSAQRTGDCGDLDTYDDRPDARSLMRGIIRDWGWRHSSQI